MRVLLVNPTVLDNPLVEPNLSLGYLATALRAAGHEPVILDELKKPAHRPRDLRTYLEQQRFDAAGVHVYAMNALKARAILRTFREVNPRGVTLLGGPYVAATPEAAMNVVPEADYGFHAEGERGVPRLLDRLAAGALGDPTTVENLVWRDGDHVCFGPKVFEPNLDALGVPAWDLIAPAHYSMSPLGIFTQRLPLATMITSRGCPYPCNFCTIKSITGNRTRRRSVAHVLDEIRLLKREHGVREIHFVDDHILGNPDGNQKGPTWLTELCEAMVRERIDVTWTVPQGVRLDGLDEPLVRLMERAGCHAIGVGIESGSQRVLDAMEKKLDLATIREKVALVRRATKIKVEGLVMLGYPGETPEEIDATIRMVQALPLSFCSFLTYMPWPGAEPNERALAASGLAPADYERMGVLNVIDVPGQIPAKDLRRYDLKAFLSFYLRAHILLGIASELKHLGQLRIVLGRIGYIAGKLARVAWAGLRPVPT